MDNTRGAGKVYHEFLAMLRAAAQQSVQPDRRGDAAPGQRYVRRREDRASHQSRSNFLH